LCRIPNWWKSSAAQIRLNITAGTAPPSFVGMDAILDFDALLLVVRLVVGLLYGIGI
jgi:hypothetical protein